MSDASNVTRGLRERLSGNTEERLGRAFSDLLENSVLTGAIGRAFDAREKAAQAQEVAMGALNIPSAADIERLTRRLRSVSHRLEGIEDGVDRLDRTLTPRGADPAEIGQRLSAIEAQLEALTEKLDQAARREASARGAAGAGGAGSGAGTTRAAGAAGAAAASPVRRRAAKAKAKAKAKAATPKKA